MRKHNITSSYSGMTIIYYCTNRGCNYAYTAKTLEHQPDCYGIQSQPISSCRLKNPELEKDKRCKCITPENCTNKDSKK